MKTLSKDFWTEKIGIAQALVAGGKKLAIDLSLIAVSGYSVYGAYFYETHTLVRYALIAAAALIVLQGIFEFGKDLVRIAGHVETRPTYKHQAVRPRAH